MPEPMRMVKVRNLTEIKQSTGWMQFGPGEIVEVEEAKVPGLLQFPYFEVVDAVPRLAPPPRPTKPILPSRQSGLLAEVRKALRPDPPTPGWIAKLNRDCFPCQTDEFEPVQKAEKTFQIVFRLMDVSEMNGGTRFILRLAGHLGRRGHDVTVSCFRASVKPEDLSDIPITFVVEPHVRDGQFVCGTYWTTSQEIAAAPLGGTRLGLLQAPEPSWPEMKPAFRQSVASFTDPNVKYFTIGPSLAKVCKKEYGTEVFCALPGSCIDSVAFSPRINDHNIRDQVFFIYRRAPWKGCDTVLRVIEAYRQLRPQTKVIACGFTRWTHPLLDEFLVDPPSDDVPDLYSGSDFYLTAGQFEGSPLPPLEAMACGCIPVCSESGVLDYLRDGENGILLDPKRPQQVAQRMAAIMDDEKQRQALKRNGVLTAKERPLVKLFLAFEEGVSALDS